MKSHLRSLYFESLENRRVLSAAPSAIDTGALLRFENAGQNAGEFLRNSNIDASELVERHAPESVQDWTPLVAGDFNNDGLTDVYGERPNGEAWLNLNDGERLYLVPWGDALPDSRELLGTGDFNNDGLTDIFVRDDADQIQISLNDRDRGFRQTSGSPRPGTANELFVADFDNDGFVDVMGTEDGRWKLGKSDGVSMTTVDWGPFPAYDWQNVVHGDFDGDDFFDVAARAPDNTWWVWRGSESGQLPAKYWGHWKYATADEWFDVRVDDINADGLDDIIGRGDDGSLWVASSVSTSFYSWRWGTGWGVGGNWQHIVSTDVTGDGLLDQVGKADDGTWWVAENMGDRFKNSFLDRNPNVHFAAAVDNFTAAEPNAIFNSIPNAEDGLVQSSSVTTPLQISINENDDLVVIGSGQLLVGIEFQSASGSLVPIDLEAAVHPFTESISNSSQRVRLTTSEPVTVDGSITLGVKWDRKSTTTDLRVSYDAVQVSARIDSSIFRSPEVIGADNLTHYYERFTDELPPVVNEQSTNDPTTEVEIPEEQPLEEEPTKEEPTGQPNVEAPEEIETQDPEEGDVTGDPVEATEVELGTSIEVRIEDDGKFFISPTSAIAHALRIESPTRSLLPGDSPAPFGQFVVSDAGLIVLASVEAVEFSQITSLDIGWLANNPTDDLIVEYATTDSGWQSAELFGSRISEPSINVPNDSVDDADTPPTFDPIMLTLDDQQNFVIKGAGQQILGLNFVSPAGGLIGGTSPLPFDVFVANRPNHVALGTWGSLVTVDGDVTLDVAWNPDINIDELIVEVGDSDANVQLAVFDMGTSESGRRPGRG